ncbi:hypothetical protein [Streptomyces sp. SP18CS02]|uniref:hypothetical protein n=1 Tax=Streptomyces sp. SP18CS02 TaxID=3002531 RepID=UPI002E7A4C62|nr:hypothetical protein [Streptomyces sp. SP18CS02]MEE1753662.1 hypothetical protein [Streptomyces sp. SP18CS02]
MEQRFRPAMRPGRTSAAGTGYFRGRIDDVVLSQWARDVQHLRAEASELSENGQPTLALMAHGDASVSGGGC